jgi:Protein of unknown function (DUF664)
MTEDNVLDITIPEPPMTGNDVELLIFALDRSRAQFAWKCGGLDAAGLNKAHPPTAMTLGGLLKHLAGVEDPTTAEMLTGQPVGAPWDAVDFEADPEWEWRTAAGNSPEELYGLWRGALERSRAAVATVLAHEASDQPTMFTTRAGQLPDLRWVLVDLHDAYARHLGHADLLREAVDGLVGEDPPQP